MGDVAAVANVWLACWAIRRSFRLDRRLDKWEVSIRWIAVALCLGSVVEIPELLGAWGRLIAGFSGVAILCWPNLAYHVANFLRHLNVVPKRVRIEGEDAS